MSKLGTISPLIEAKSTHSCERTGILEEKKA